MSNLVPLIKVFLTVQVQTKLFHWMSTSYTTHIILDEFYKNFHKLYDAFVESSIGSNKKMFTELKNAITIQTSNFQDKFVDNMSEKEILSNYYEGIINSIETYSKPIENQEIYKFIQDIINEIRTLRYKLNME